MRDGNVVEPFTVDNCVPLTVDRTSHRVEWKGGADLSGVASEVREVSFSSEAGGTLFLLGKPGRIRR